MEPHWALSNPKHSARRCQPSDYLPSPPHPPAPLPLEEEDAVCLCHGSATLPALIISLPGDRYVWPVSPPTAAWSTC